MHINKTSEAQCCHLRFICPIHPYSAATIKAVSYDETIVIQASGYTVSIHKVLYLCTCSALKTKHVWNSITQVDL